MTTERFEAVLLSGHKDAAVEVPFDPSVRWSIPGRPLWKGRRGHAVQCRIGKTAFESVVVPRSKKFWLLVPEEILEGLDIDVGATIRVAVEPAGSGPRTSSVARGPKQQARAVSKQKRTFDDVRSIARALPRSEEVTSYGTPAFKVGGKLFVRLHQDGDALVVNVELATRAGLIESNPEVFFVTDHYRAHPRVLVRFEDLDDASLRGILEASWRQVAPPRALAQLPAE